MIYYRKKMYVNKALTTGQRFYHFGSIENCDKRRRPSTIVKKK